METSPISARHRLGLVLGLAAASCNAPDPSALFARLEPAALQVDAGAEAPAADDTPVGAGAFEGSGAPEGSEAPDNDGVPGGDGAFDNDGAEPASAGAEAAVDAGAMNPAPSPPSSEPAPPLPPAPPDAGASAPPPLDAGALPPGNQPPACGGALLGGSCWYLGELGQTCDDVCVDSGGFAPAALAAAGTPAQGGSLEGCTAVLQALGALPGVVTEGFREDGLGFGCHLFVDPSGAATAWWLTAPDLSPAAANPSVRVACGCAR